MAARNHVLLAGIERRIDRRDRDALTAEDLDRDRARLRARGLA
jgi:hypothetical protein